MIREDAGRVATDIKFGRREEMLRAVASHHATNRTLSAG